MKGLLSLVALGALMVSTAQAQDAPPPAPAADGEMVATAEVVELFACVKYEDLDHIAPCAVPKIIMVPDPCACCDPCSCCAPKCVAVQICVPPCACEEKVKCSKNGRKQKYDYGKYRVEVEVKDGYVKVDYDN